MWDLDRINRASEGQRRRLETYKRILEDSEKDQRLKESLCPYCYYSSFITGQAFTEYTCQLSGRVDMWPNTGVPTIHPEIAKKVKLCYDCGADLNYKALRKEREWKS